MNQTLTILGTLSIALSGLLAGGCEGGPTSPRDGAHRKTPPRSGIPGPGAVSPLVRSWEVVDRAGRDPFAPHAAAPLLSGAATLEAAAPDSVAACNELKVYMTLHHFGAALEIEAHFRNPNQGTWHGELNLDFASESEPSVRHVVVQNVDVEIAPEGWVSLYALLVSPAVPGFYDFRAFGISGETSRSFRIGRVMEVPAD